MDYSKKIVTVSLVTFNTSERDIFSLLDSFAKIEVKYYLYVIDNSPKSTLKKYFDKLENVQYIHNPSNPGFGASHNIGINLSIEKKADFHVVINPDVYFQYDVISPMIEYMANHKDVGMLMPQIMNTDGTIQNLPKLLPSPFSVLMRKFKFPKFIYLKFVNNYELRFVQKDMVYEAPVLSGCFTMFRIKVLEEIGGYDDQFFMYFEDWDLSRRVHTKYKTIYFPTVSVFHGYESGANKSKRLFKIFIKSAIYYFNKWGWFWDSQRREINSRTMKQFQQ